MKPYLPILLLSVGLSSGLTSCTSSGGGMSKGLIGAAGGGLIGSLISSSLFKKNDNSSNAAAAGGGAAGTTSNNNSFLDDNQGLITGAAAGYAAGAITDAMAKNEVRQKYLDGYNKGRSDAIKDLYWVKRDAERPSSDASVQRRYYEVPVPEHITTDGVLVEPRKVVIEVVE
ncbi:MAG: hypothetical protein ACO1TE_12295 [Prosthecobacter sp.]